jgi:hypothetical protein
MADSTHESHPEIIPEPGHGVTPDPWHDSPDTQPASDKPDAAADKAAVAEAAVAEAAVAEAAVAEPELKKKPHPWHD